MEISELAAALVEQVNLLELDWDERREVRPEVAEQVRELRIRAEQLFGPHEHIPYRTVRSNSDSS